MLTISTNLQNYNLQHKSPNFKSSPDVYSKLCKLAEAMDKESTFVTKEPKSNLLTNIIQKRLLKFCRSENRDKITSLLKRHPKLYISKHNKNGMSCIGMLAKGKHTVDVVNMLAQMENLDVNRVDSEGWTDMHYLCRYGYADAVKYIIEKHQDFDVNKRTKDGESYIELAQNGGHYDIVDLLVKVPTLDVNKINRDGETDMHILCKGALDDSIKYVLEKYPELDINKHSRGKSSYIKLSLEANVNSNIINMMAKIPTLDVNKTDKYGWTDLHYLCRDGYADAVEHIIKNHPKLDINKRTKGNNSYLDIARDYNQSDVEKVLTSFIASKS